LNRILGFIPAVRLVVLGDLIRFPRSLRSSGIFLCVSTPYEDPPDHRKKGAALATNAHDGLFSAIPAYEPMRRSPGLVSASGAISTKLTGSTSSFA